MTSAKLQELNNEWLEIRANVGRLEKANGKLKQLEKAQSMAAYLASESHSFSERACLLVYEFELESDLASWAGFTAAKGIINAKEVYDLNERIKYAAEEAEIVADKIISAVTAMEKEFIVAKLVAVELRTALVKHAAAKEAMNESNRIEAKAETKADRIEAARTNIIIKSMETLLLEKQIKKG